MMDNAFKYEVTYRRVIVRFCTAFDCPFSISMMVYREKNKRTCKVKGYSEWRTQFVITSIAFSYRGIRVVYPREHACSSQLRSCQKYKICD